MKINVIKPSTDSYRASFEITRDDEYYELASLLGFPFKRQYGDDPIDAVKSLVKVALEKIKSVGITSTPLIGVIDEIGNEKIKELEAMETISLDINEGKKNAVAEVYDVSVIRNKMTAKYKMFISSGNLFCACDVPYTKLSEIHGSGDNEIEAIDDLVSSLNSYEKIVLDYIKDVRELCEREKDKRKGQK